jgi:Asp-tRNA(Asn)/Glu-tRNA(Gln) amidotransferase A subunit family amidase
MSAANVRKSRRNFLKAVPVAVAGAVASKSWAQGQGSQNAGPVTADTVKAAEVLDGVQFTPDEETAAARGANANLNNYNRIRQLNIPQDTEPAYVFKPSLPGKEPKGPATPGAVIKYTKPPLTLKRPANLEDVAFWPVTRLAALVERKLVTSTELTNMYLSRLKKYQPILNFYVTLTEELALKQAADADRAIAAGKYKGPLHGIPWGAKDLFATKGIKTTWGGEPYVNQIIDYDATIVERLRDAGAVLVAKLALGALAQGDQWFGGRTNNPWQPDPKNAPSGSSGSSAGPGSATAAGCVGFGIGTETRGSIMSPTSVNGVVGLRPTYGRISRYGAMALSTTMDKVGPLCRYVEDCVVVFNAIYGPDKHDGSVADAVFRWNPLAPLSGYTIAYAKTAFENAGQRGGGRGPVAAAPVGAAGGAGAVAGGAGAAGAAGARGETAARGGRSALTPEEQAAQAAEIKKMYDNVLDVYRKLGAKLVPIDVPPEINQIANAIGFILETESGASFDAATRSGDINKLAAPATSRSSWPNTFRQARLVPAVEYIQAMRARTLLIRQFDDFMSQYDALLEPGTGGTLSATNLTGHPAIALKCGFIGGLPRPIMLTGRLYEEATICRIALAYEQATEWKDKHPTLTA